MYENGRVTVMFCSFDANPRILRLFCWGEVVEWDDEPAFGAMVARMGKKEKVVVGARAVVRLRVWKVSFFWGGWNDFCPSHPRPQFYTEYCFIFVWFQMGGGFSAELLLFTYVKRNKC